MPRIRWTTDRCIFELRGEKLNEVYCLLITHSYKKDCEKNFIGSNPRVYN